MNRTIDRILDLIQSHNITAKYLVQTLNMSTTAVTDWKKGKAAPSIDALIKIAQYFNVSLDYLVFGKVGPDITINDLLSDDELEIVNKFKKLNDMSKAKALAYIDGMLSSNTNERVYL